MHKTVTLYFHRNRESNYELGRELGLKGEALDRFRYLGDVGVELDVDCETGKVKYEGGKIAL